MPNPTAIEVLRRYHTPDWGPDDDDVVILDALKLAAVVEHPRVEDVIVKVSGEVQVSFWDDPQEDGTCLAPRTPAEAFAALFPEDA